MQETCETALLLAAHLARRLQPVAHAIIKTLVPIFDNRRSKVCPMKDATEARRLATLVLA